MHTALPGVDEWLTQSVGVRIKERLPVKLMLYWVSATGHLARKNTPVSAGGTTGRP